MLCVQVHNVSINLNLLVYMSKVPAKSSPKRIKIADALNTIYKTAKHSGLPETLFIDLKEEFNVVRDFIQCDEKDALVFSVVCSMNLFGENVDSNDLLRYFEVTPFELINYSASLTTLSERSILVKRKNRRRSDDFLRKHSFSVNLKILDAIIAGEPMPSELKFKALDLVEALEKMNDVCQDCISEQIDSNDLLDEMNRLIDENSDFSFIELVKKLEIDLIDKTIFLYIVWKSINGSISVDMDEPIGAFFKRSTTRVQYMQGIYKGTNQLINQNLVEYAGGRFFNDVEFLLTDHSIQLLGDHGVIVNRRKSNRGTIKPDDIAAKILVYESEEDRQIKDLARMLDTSYYDSLMKRLKDKALPENFNILLFGAPGTGKTESVYQLAKATGREIMKVEISQSKSMWFGESEKLVKKIFRDYIELHKSLDLAPILLFNEADAILSSRKTNSQSSVSQTENAIQNILLEELENFKGIFIATTNLAENLDKAFDRRFLFKIKFNNPGITSRAAIWKIKMPTLTDSEATALAEAQTLSGGQIDNIIRKVEIQSLLNDEIPNIEQLLKFCDQEIILQNTTKSIGFGKS